MAQHHLLALLLILLHGLLVFSQAPSFTQDPQTAIVLLFTSVNLTCTATPSTATYEWRRGEAQISDSLITIIAGILKITSFNDALSGDYSCLATNDDYSISSAIANVRAPELSVASTSAQFMVDANGVIIIPCGDITAYPLAELDTEWEQEIGPTIFVELTNTNRPFIRADGSLVITDATATTNYRCRISLGSFATPKAYTVALDVTSTQATPPASPVISPPVDVTANEGIVATFTCIAVDGATVGWTYPSTAPSTNIIITDGNTRLRAVSVDSSFEGTYSCNVTTPTETVISTATLTVIAPPTMTTSLSPTTVKFGAELMVTCTASGRGITWRWYHNGTAITPTATDASAMTSSTSSFTVAATVRQSAGAYQCFAYNSAGNARDVTIVEIEVQPPSITTGLMAIVAFVGQSVTLMCAADGAPPPTFTWAKGPLPITMIDGSNGMLPLASIDRAAEDMYTCTARSTIDNVEVGTASSSAMLFVTDRTRFTTTLPTALKVATGKGFQLNCTATHSTDTTIVLEWTRDGEQLSTGGSTDITITTSGTTVSSLLHIMQTVQEDAGDYNCAAVTTYTAGSRPAPSIAPLTSSVTITDAPIVPEITMIEVLDAQTLRVSWLYIGVLSDINNFIVEYREHQAEEFNKIISGKHSVTQVTINSLRPHTKYTVRVTVVHLDMSMGYSNESIATTPQTAPTGPPQSVIATMPLDDNSTLHVQWEPPEEEAQNGIIIAYTIQYWVNGTRDANTPTVIRLRGNSTTITLMRLIPGTTYAVQVAANTSVGMGPYSSTVYGTTFMMEPIAPPPPFYHRIWFIALCVVVIVFSILLLGCIVVIMKQRKKRKSGRFAVRHSGFFDGPIENVSLTDDVVADYENRKKEQMTSAFSEGVDVAESETSMSTTATKSTYNPSSINNSYRIPGMAPPGYIEPPSFEATLRARSASMSALEKHIAIGGTLPRPLTSSHTYIPTNLDDKQSRDSDESGHVHQYSHTPDFATFV